MGARLVQVFAVVVCAASCAVGCTREVAGGLDESEANRAVVSLSRAGVDAEKTPDPAAEGRFRLVVNRDEATLAISVLAGEELPRPRALAAKDPGWVASPEADRRASIVATAVQVERTLTSIDGVLDARVHLDVPTVDPWMAAVASSAPPNIRPTASVLLRHRGATPPIGIDDVRRLVAGAVAGLAVTDVTVIGVSVPTPSWAGDRELAHLGPIAVTRGSLGTLRMIALCGVLVVALLAATILLLSTRLRRLVAAGAAQVKDSSDGERARGKP